MNGLRLLVLCFTSLLPALGSAGTIVFDFEELPIGQQFGGPVGDMPGDVILTQPGAELSVEMLEDGGFSGPFFNVAEVSEYGRTPRSLELNEISIGVTFTNPSRSIRRVVLELEGRDTRSDFATLQLNDGDLHVEGNVFTFDFGTPDGIVVRTSPFQGASTIEITATGNKSIESLRIGSRLTLVDTITAFSVPEPAASTVVSFGVLALSVIRLRK